MLQVVQVADQVERMSQMSFRLCLLMQQVGDVYVPEQEYVLLLVGDITAGGYERREDRLGLNAAPAAGPPAARGERDVFGDVFPAFGFVLCPC